jgi:hypothetical protein
LALVAVSPDGVLMSPIGPFRWDGIEFRAMCPDTPALSECWCGIYAFTSPADCWRHIRATRMFAPKLLTDPAYTAGVALGRVQLSDDAVVAKRPPQSAIELKASSVRIVELFANDQALAERLAARYNLPPADADLTRIP